MRATQEIKMSEDWTYKLGKIEGRISGIEERLNHIETRLDKKVGKWEIRIWFITMMAFISFWSSIFLHFIA